MNPCPCGRRGDPRHACSCSDRDVARYRRKISGPLLDRIDLHVDVPPLPASDFHGPGDGEPSAAVRARVVAARARQTARTGTARITNASLPARMARAQLQPETAARALLERAVEKMGLSARGYQRVLRVARTVADLEGAERITPAHVAESLRYRPQAPGS